MEARRGGDLLFISPYLLITYSMNYLSRDYNVLDTVLGSGDPVVGRILLCFVVSASSICIKLEAQMDNYKL